MNKLSFTLFILIFLNNCSFNENSRLWQDKEIQLDTDKNIKKILSDDKKIVTEFNQGLKIELTGIKTTDIVVDNQNNFGSQNYEGLVNKIGNYKFSKLKKYKKNQSLRKPNTGMIDLAKKKWDIDLKKSLLIGDQLTDKQTAINIGMKYKILKFHTHLK